MIPGEFHEHPTMCLIDFLYDFYLLLFAFNFDFRDNQSFFYFFHNSILL